MQQISVYIRKQYLIDQENSSDFFLYEVSFPAIKIGELLYIRALQEQITLTDKDTFVKRYTGSENIDQISVIKEDILKMYPEEVRKYVVFIPLY